MTPSQVPRLELFAYSARSPACSQKRTVLLAWFPFDRYDRSQWMEGLTPH
jgi:hypothetical protein